MYGMIGRLLRVNLDKQTIQEEVIPEEKIRKYLGGIGLGTRYFWDEVKAGTDAFDKTNPLIFMSGLLTGTPSPSASRYSVVTKSPLTGLWTQSNSGGSWGVDIKHAGFDGIIFEGESNTPVYLVIDDGKANLQDASELWGLNVGATTEFLKEKYGRETNVACIGIGGENLVRYASIMNDLHRGAGRCGTGAVMGRKKLKAVAVKGNRKIKVPNPKEFNRVVKRQNQLMNESILNAGLKEYGTTLVLSIVNNCGGLPTRNWQTGYCSFEDEVNGEALREKVFIDVKGCYACPIKCGRKSHILKGPWKGEEGEGPEFETVGVFGPMCGNPDFETITKAGYLCNDYGIDTISCGSTIAFAMECFEKGILTEKDTGGINLSFGNKSAIIEMVKMIAERKDIGNLLAEGTRIMSEKLKKGSEKFAMHVRGMELPCYDPRAAKLTGLAYVTANRGGDHITAFVEAPTFLATPFLIIEESEIRDILKEDPADVKILKDLEDALTTFDAAGSCKFMGMTLAAEEWADIIRVTTGWEDYTVDEFRKTGERIYNLARACNVRDGLTRADDKLPYRLTNEPLPDGAAKGETVNLKELLKEYYKCRDWDNPEGKPSPEKLNELGLADVRDVLYGETE